MMVNLATGLIIPGTTLRKIPTCEDAYTCEKCNLFFQLPNLYRVIYKGKTLLACPPCFHRGHNKTTFPPVVYKHCDGNGCMRRAPYKCTKCRASVCMQHAEITERRLLCYACRAEFKGDFCTHAQCEDLGKHRCDQCGQGFCYKHLDNDDLRYCIECGALKWQKKDS